MADLQPKQAYLEELARKLDPYVEEGRIYSAKYNREPAPFARGSLVICVYCNDREREEVWKILSTLGVKKNAYGNMTAKHLKIGSLATSTERLKKHVMSEVITKESVTNILVELWKKLDIHDGTSSIRFRWDDVMGLTTDLIMDL